LPSQHVLLKWLLGNTLLLACRFRLKYHPEEFDKRLEEARAGLLARSRVFTRLLEMNRVSPVAVDVEHSENIVKLLDAGLLIQNFK